MALYHSPDYQTNFKSIGLSIQEFDIDFQAGGHLGFPIRIILATLIYKSLSTSSVVSCQLPFGTGEKVQNRLSNGC